MKKKSWKFAVIGDTHFCWKKQHPGQWCPEGQLSRVPDYIRYQEMTETCGKALLKKIAGLQPEFLISTGDFVEGGLQQHPDFARDEMRAGWQLLQQAGVPVLIAKGTHEGAPGTPGGEFFRNHILPEMAKGCGSDISREYYRFDAHDCVFLILDYLEFKSGGQQEAWLINELEKSARSTARLFLVAHPPLFLWGRHFFDNPDFAVRIRQLCRKYAVDAYFCGHTHNQSISFHPAENTANGFLQLTGSAVGYLHLPTISLNTFHQLAKYDTGDQYLWGILEDSAPGFFLIEGEGETSRIEWHSLNDSAELTVPGRRQPPCISKRPAFTPVEHCLQVADLHQIQNAWLHIFSVIPENNDSEIRVNGIVAGTVPENASYAARRFVALPDQVIATLNRSNHLEIRMPNCQTFAIGSISLEVLLYDRRRIHSRVAGEHLVCGKVWQSLRQPKRFHTVCPGETVAIELFFDPSAVDISTCRDLSD